jgi:MFS transporter, DHA1 family, multidrug resistance protein
MSLDDGPPPLRIDWTAQRTFLGRPVYVWQTNLAALLAVLFVAFVGFSFAGPFLPLLVRHLGVTEPRAVALWSGVLIGLGPLSAAVASPVWGRLADRIGGRLLLLRTVFGFAALNALSAMATDVWQLAVLRLLMGALGGFTAVALTLASLSAPPEQTTRAIALVQSAQILGQMVGPAFGGLVADHWGIRAAFVGSSGLAVVAGVHMLLMYQESPASRQQRRQQRTGRSRMRLRDLLGTPGFAPLLVVLFVGTFANRSSQPLIPLFVASTGAAAGTVASVTGMIVAAGALAATLSANLASRLVAYFPHAQVLVVALVACACGSGLLANSHTALQFGLLRVAVGLFEGSILTLSYGLGASVIPVDNRASAFGLLHSGAQIGSAVGPMLGGVLAACSLRVAFLWNAVLFCGGALVAWRWLRARREGSLPPEPPGTEG